MSSCRHTGVNYSSLAASKLSASKLCSDGMGWGRRILCFAGSVVISPAALAQSQQGVGLSQALTLLLGLGAVVLLILGCAWLIKRIGGMSPANAGAIKVLAVLPLGSRERVALIEVGGQQLLIGVTAQQITRLHHFDEPVLNAGDLHSKSHSKSEFAQKLHQLMSRS